MVGISNHHIWHIIILSKNSMTLESCGSNIEDFKELLKERGIKREVLSIPVEKIDEEVETIVRM